MVWKQISQQLLKVWSSYIHLLTTYIQGIQNNGQHCHRSTTPHPTLFRFRENVFFANFQYRTKENGGQKKEPECHEKFKNKERTIYF